MIRSRWGRSIMDMMIQEHTYEQLLEPAKGYAYEGIVSLTLVQLDRAKECATKEGISIPDEVLQEVEDTAYRKGAEATLIFAKNNISEGLKSLALVQLKKAKEYAIKANLDISERVQEIQLSLKNTC